MEKHMPKNNFFCLFYISNFNCNTEFKKETKKKKKKTVQLMVTNKI